MRSLKFPVAIAVLVLASLGATGCGNRNGAGGTSDSTSAEAYELGSEKNLASPMESVKTTAVDSTVADTTKHVGK